jgi:hypothetical protein
VTSEQPWTEVTRSHRSEWRALFNVGAGPHVDGACPVCGATTLHRWYVLDEDLPRELRGIRFSGPGRLWEWCSTCHSYEHYRDGTVPASWVEPWPADRDELRFDPGPIETRRTGLAP